MQKTTRCLLLLVCLVPGLASPQQESNQQGKAEKYIAKYTGLAVQLMHEYCIPASLILGVALVESGACSSRNCKLLNNHFGMKAPRKYTIPGTSHITAYRQYESDTASFIHFCTYITRRKFFPALWDQTDYAVWVAQLGKSGYARAHARWKNDVLYFIRKYKLHALDQY